MGSFILVDVDVLDLMTFTLKEFKRLNPTLISDDFTVENSLSMSFHKLVQRELDPIWHQLSGKTKQLVSDLKTLRTVLVYLTQYDCITFYSFVASLRTAESALKSGGWVLLDSAETLFLTAKLRVFDSLQHSTEIKSKDQESKRNFEENPKWAEIGKIVQEIKDELQSSGIPNDSLPSERVLVVTRDERTANQVRDYLSLGSQQVLGRLYNKCLGEKHGYLPQFSEEKEMKHKGIGKKSGNELDIKKDIEVVPSPIVLFHALDSCQSFDTTVLLMDVKPRYIIMYDSDMTFVRQVEVGN